MAKDNVEPKDNKNLRAFIKIFLISLTTFIVINMFIFLPSMDDSPRPIKKTQYKAQDWFNLSGEHILLKELAQAYLKFPSTYSHIKTVYSKDDEKEELVVKTYFSGESSLRTLQEICLIATYNYNGRLLSKPNECL